MGAEKRQVVFRETPLSLPQLGGVRAPYLGDGITRRVFFVKHPSF